MNRYLKKYKNAIGLAAFVGVLILAFHLLTNFFTMSNSKPKTIILDSSLFEESSNNDLKTLKVEGVDLIETGHSIWNLTAIDNSTVLYSTAEITPKQQNQVTQMVDINTRETLSQLEGQNASGHIVSNDGKKLMYVAIEQESLVERTYILDIEENRIISNLDGRGLAFLPGDDAIIAIDGEYLYRQNLVSGHRRILIEFSKASKELVLLEEIIEGFDGYYNLENQEAIKYKILRTIELQVSVRGDKLYFLAPYLKEPAIFSIDLEQENSLEVLVKGNIYEFNVLTNRSILLRGQINGEEGIYLYDIGNRSYQPVIKGAVLKYDITADGRLAYVLQNDRGNYELHVAYYDGDAIKADEIIYIDTRYAVFLSWSRGENKLFYSNSSVKGSQIYRFNFSR